MVNEFYKEFDTGYTTVGSAVYEDVPIPSKVYVLLSSNRKIVEFIASATNIIEDYYETRIVYNEDNFMDGLRSTLGNVDLPEVSLVAVDDSVIGLKLLNL